METTVDRPIRPVRGAGIRWAAVGLVGAGALALAACSPTGTGPGIGAAADHPAPAVSAPAPPTPSPAARESEDTGLDEVARANESQVAVSQDGPPAEIGQLASRTSAPTSSARSVSTVLTNIAVQQIRTSTGRPNAATEVATFNGSRLTFLSDGRVEWRPGPNANFRADLVPFRGRWSSQGSAIVFSASARSTVGRTGSASGSIDGVLRANGATRITYTVSSTSAAVVNGARFGGGSSKVVTLTATLRQG